MSKEEKEEKEVVNIRFHLSTSNIDQNLRPKKGGNIVSLRLFWGCCCHTRAVAVFPLICAPAECFSACCWDIQ